MKIKLKIFVFSLTIGSLQLLFGQSLEEKTEISLNEALELASKNNWDIRKQQTGIASVKANLNKTRSIFLPSIQLSSGYTRTDDPLAIIGYKLQERIITEDDFKPNIVNNAAIHEHFNIRFMIKQPIINIDSWIDRKAVDYKLQATKKLFERTNDNITFIVKQTYFSLQLAETKKEVIKKALIAIKAYYKTARDNYKQGYLIKSDLLKIEVRKIDLESQLEEAENTKKHIGEKLNFLLGRKHNLPIKTKDKLQYLPSDDKQIVVSENIETRADLLAMNYQVKATKKMVQASKLKFVPDLNAFGSYNINDNEFFNNTESSWMLGLRLTWNVFKGFRKIGEIQQNKASFTKAKIAYDEYLENSKIELLQAARGIEIAKNQVAMQKSAVKYAQESHEITANRFEQGLEKVADLLHTETTYSEKKLAYINAIYNFNTAKFYYDFLTKNSQR